MRCSTRNCNRSKDINPVTRLCPSCQSVADGHSKRFQNQYRQSQARAGMQDLQRDLDVTLSPVVGINQRPPNNTGSSPDLMAFLQPSVSDQNGAAAVMNNQEIVPRAVFVCHEYSFK